MRLLDSPALDGASRTGSTAAGLVMAEIMKVRATRAWWLFLAGFAVFTALALANNGFSHHFQLYPQADVSDRARALAQAAEARTPAGATAIAVSMMTSGQFLSVLFPLFFGILLMTGEFAHRTAAATFLVVPRRTPVIVAKLGAAACFAAGFWLIATVLDGIVTPVFLHSQHVSVGLASWLVIRTVLLNLLALVFWAVFGVGAGALIRGQVAAVVTGVAVYGAGYLGAEAVFRLIYGLARQDWLLGAPVVAPASASNVMVMPAPAFSHAPPQWAGLLIMAGYALVLAVAGAARTRRLDIP